MTRNATESERAIISEFERAELTREHVHELIERVRNGQEPPEPMEKPEVVLARLRKEFPDRHEIDLSNNDVDPARLRSEKYVTSEQDREADEILRALRQAFPSREEMRDRLPDYRPTPHQRPFN